jgi:outer membrane receptor protein involved in Fe transport
MNKLLLFLTLLFATTAVSAQTTGSIKGKITDKEDGSPLPGVNVIIKGTSFGGATDFDGNFELKNIRPGEYALEFSFLGYERVLMTGIKVSAGKVTEANVALGVEVLTGSDEVVVIGEKPIFDVEKSSSGTSVSRTEIEAAPVRRVEDVVGQQSGVTKDPTGLYIKGGRAYETGFVVDGVSAQDPLSGTGFGLDVGAGSIASVDVVTGGVGAEYGDVTSGVVSVKTQDGGDKYSGFVSHKRDNPGSNTSASQNFFFDIWEMNFGGPSLLFEKLLPSIGLDLPGKFTFFASGQMSWQDEFTKVAADSVRSSIIDNAFWSPRQDNRWNGMLKLTWNVKPGLKIQGAYQRSLTVNQNRNMLLITDANVQVQPGFQFPFMQNLNNANTFAASTVLSYLKLTHSISKSAYYDLQASRLFTRLRVDANGRSWRPQNVEGELDPESIVTYPVTEFLTPRDFMYVLAGPGYINNGGLATLWHDHYAEEYTFKGSFTKLYNKNQNQFVVGFESKLQDYQWIDLTRPWVGAPILIGTDSNGQPVYSETQRLGESSDIWQVEPRRGAIYINNQIRYQGLIANVGLRYEYWAPGKYVDDAVENPQAPIPDVIRQAYKDDTFAFGGLRYKARLLPKLSVSFPVRENQVLFFNYGHSTRVPHPSFVYAGLDPFYQNRSFLPNLGNPNLNPEVSINYEIGLRNQITANDALNISAFWNDRYDFVTSERITIIDVTGRESERAFRVNGDFARSRGVEATYIKRYKDWFRGNLAVTYSRAEGLNSTNSEGLQQIIVGGQAIGNNVETPLAWDRPWDIKSSFTFTYNRKNDPLLGVRYLNNLQLFISSNWRSGIRYTPNILRGFQPDPAGSGDVWRPIYERDPNPEARFSKVGPWWWIVDMNLQKTFWVRKTRFVGFLEITNLLNRKNVIIVNPVTGKGYRTDYPTDSDALAALRSDRSYDVPSGVRDPRYLDPRDNSLPGYENPANFLEQRHVVFGLSMRF